MSRSELTPTTFDHAELKASLINYLRTKETFQDFDYEGSAINTIVDLLVRNSVYSAFNANMVANESFIESAQIRGNVSSHAQKLSYVPRSKTAARLVCDISITPANTPTEFVITEQPGLVFLSASGGETYRFTTNDEYAFSYNSNDGKFHATGVDLYQGQFIQRIYTYNGGKIVIENQDIDTSTLMVYVDDEVLLNYQKATSITEVGANQNVFFLREAPNGNYEITFGRDILGNEPSIGSTIVVRYINAYQNHANGIKTLIAASSIGDYSNISVTVTQPSYGGIDRESIEEIRYVAPRAYQAQDRALAPFDYILLVKREFPFLRSVISWGGEDNVPPRFGTQIISIVPDVGIEVTNSLKSRIESAVRLKGVGSVTPVVVEPVVFDAVLNVQYKVIKPLINTSRSALESLIKQRIVDYSEQFLYAFEAYYNESDLIRYLINNIKELETLVISEQYSTRLQSFRNMTSKYEVAFNNTIKPGTFKVSNFAVTFEATNELIYDDSNGNIIYSYSKSGITRTKTIGTVNYSTGHIEFTVMFTHSGDSIEVSTQIEGQNFYVNNNSVVRIVNATTSEIAR